MTSDTPGLSVPINVKMAQLERQLARIDAMVVKGAKRMELVYERANGNVSRSLTKSAETSAQVFQRAIARHEQNYRRLKSSIDPAFAANQRYEAAVRDLDAAVKIGAISQRQANAVLEQAKTAYLGAATAAEGASVVAGRFYAVSGQGRFVLQNVAYQVGDFAVQVGAGTDMMRAASMQVPQLLGAFGALGGTMGVLGPLLGTVAAIGFPVAAVLLSMGDNAEQSADKVGQFADAFNHAESAINNANAAVRRAASGDLDALRDAYGEVNDRVIELIGTLARLEVEKSLVATRSAIDQLFEQNDGVSSLMEAVETRSALHEQTLQRIADLEASALRDSPQVRAELEQLRQMAANFSD
ncbi:MAG: hypothetical protein AAF330_08145, partial [Pseudomonadota bacterium]